MSLGKKPTLISSAKVSSCLIAAGRYTSALTTNTFFFSRSVKNFANFATEVVLPAPCKPAINTTAGGTAFKSSASLTSPIAASSSF